MKCCQDPGVHSAHKAEGDVEGTWPATPPPVAFAFLPVARATFHVMIDLL